jgi:hypothetical protein
MPSSLMTHQATLCLPYAALRSALNQCYCSEDSHCPTGHRCVASLAFPGYKLCKAPLRNQPGALLSQMTLSALGSLGQ